MTPLLQSFEMHSPIGIPNIVEKFLKICRGTSSKLIESEGADFLIEVQSEIDQRIKGWEQNRFDALFQMLSSHSAEFENQLSGASQGGRSLCGTSAK